MALHSNRPFEQSSCGALGIIKVLPATDMLIFWQILAISQACRISIDVAIMLDGKRVAHAQLINKEAEVATMKRHRAPRVHIRIQRHVHVWRTDAIEA